MSVLLVADVPAGQLATDVTAKTLSAARALGGEVHGLCASSNAETAAAELAKLDGLDKVLCVSSDNYAQGQAEPMTDLILSLASNYEHIVFPANAFGKNIAPRVAALLDVMVISDVMTVIGPDEFERPIYAGNAIQTVVSGDSKKVLTVRTANFDAAAAGGNAAVETLAAADSAIVPEWLGNEVQKSDRPELTSAKIIVSGGRGVGSADNFSLITALADKLGAAVGASRAAVDAGYAPNDWQVGQTGKAVAPDLYIACGISGAIQHLAGMKDSKVIV
ncbi:MAG: electron transfer flavoprotein subunit alpha/FixB family protein, partial [Thiothrix sp.]|nr:electron transfer flavoprotein subunit alpha/FixB family protein [Thiothrix sp.]